MFLEILTFALLCLVLAFKYGTVTRIVRLNRRFREAESRCKKNTEGLKLAQNERRIAEREESVLVRRQLSLEGQLDRIHTELEALREANAEVVQELIEKKININTLEALDETE